MKLRVNKRLIKVQKDALKIIGSLTNIRNDLYNIGYMRGKNYVDLLREFTEKYVCDMFNLEINDNPGVKGYDASYFHNGKKCKIQIKNSTHSNPSFRSSKYPFTYLIIIQLNDTNFSVNKIWLFDKPTLHRHLGKFNKTAKSFNYRMIKFEKYIVYQNGKLTLNTTTRNFLNIKNN